MSNSQIPLHFNIFGADGKMTQPWAFWFQEFVSNLPPSGSGFVIDGSAGTYGPMTIYQGPDINKGSSPSYGDIYVALDTGKIYVEQAGLWVTEIPAFTGDVTKPVNSTVLTLNTVNAAVGTWGDPSNFPVVTVNSKGLVTNVTLEPIVPPPGSTPGGINGSIQFNNSGSFGGTSSLVFNPGTQTLFFPNAAVTGAITFTTPSTTLNNLSPLTTKGDLLTKDGLLPNNHIRIPVGTNGQVLTADSTATGGLKWDTIEANGPDNAVQRNVGGEFFGNEQLELVENAASGTTTWLKVGGDSAVGDTKTAITLNSDTITASSSATVETFFIKTDTNGTFIKTGINVFGTPSDTIGNNNLYIEPGERTGYTSGFTAGNGVILKGGQVINSHWTLGGGVIVEGGSAIGASNSVLDLTGGPCSFSGGDATSFVGSTSGTVRGGELSFEGGHANVNGGDQAATVYGGNLNMVGGSPFVNAGHTGQLYGGNFTLNAGDVDSTNAVNTSVYGGNLTIRGGEADNTSGDVANTPYGGNIELYGGFSRAATGQTGNGAGGSFSLVAGDGVGELQDGGNANFFAGNASGAGSGNGGFLDFFGGSAEEPGAACGRISFTTASHTSGVVPGKIQFKVQDPYLYDPASEGTISFIDGTVVFDGTSYSEFFTSQEIVTSGTTHTIAERKMTTVFLSMGTVASFTITLPSSPADGQIQSLMWVDNSAFTAITWVEPNSKTLYNFPAGMAAGEAITIQYFDNGGTSFWAVKNRA